MRCIVLIEYAEGEHEVRPYTMIVVDRSLRMAHSHERPKRNKLLLYFVS